MGQALNGGQYRTFSRNEVPAVAQQPGCSRWDDGGSGGWRSLGFGQRVSTAPAVDRTAKRSKSDIDPYRYVIVPQNENPSARFGPEMAFSTVPQRY
jgi:hypothetical protein